MKTAMVSKLWGIALATAAGSIALPATAQEAGDFQVKVLGTAVLPDGEIDELNLDLVGLPAGTQTKANDNYVPTLAIEYFVADYLSIETICCLTQHDVDAVSGVPGAELVSNGLLLPATVTGKLHFNTGGVKPYVGAGIAYFIWLDDEPGETAAGAGRRRFLAQRRVRLCPASGHRRPGWRKRVPVGRRETLFHRHDGHLVCERNTGYPDRTQS